MVNWDILSALIFYGLLFLFFITHRSRFQVENKIFVMYKTKLGLDLMDRIAKKFPRLINILGYVSVTIGFLGMIVIVGFLFQGAINLIRVPNAQPILAPVLPGIKVAGLPTLSFWHWIISILIVATIHEFCHGIYSRLHNIKVKSSGFAFLGPILAAFVEPDEKQLNKASKFKQLSVLSAGAFSNIISGIIIIIIGSLILSPLSSAMLDSDGVKIISISQELPINNTLIEIGDQIEEINSVKINNVEDFIRVMDTFKPGEIIDIVTNGTMHSVELVQNPKNMSRAMLGVTVTHSKVGIKEEITAKYGESLPKFILWLSELVFWLYAISLGVGLFNLLPLGPVDGGKMFYVGIQHFIKDKKKAFRIYSYVTSVCLFLIIVNLFPYIIKLFKFIITGIMFLI